MTGLIHNLLESFVTDRIGEYGWQGVIEGAELATPDGAFTRLGHYPDADLLALVGSAAKVLGVDNSFVIRDFGEYMIPPLARMYPTLFDGHRSARDFLLTVDNVIHFEVKKLYTHVVLPRFEYESPGGDALVMIYRSPRRLCCLAEGMIYGAAKHFGSSAEITQTRCMREGADECRLEIAFH